MDKFFKTKAAEGNVGFFPKSFFDISPISVYYLCTNI